MTNAYTTSTSTATTLTEKDCEKQIVIIARKMATLGFWEMSKASSLIAEIKYYGEVINNIKSAKD